MRRAGVSVGPLDAYIRSLHDGEQFYAKWVRRYLEDPQTGTDPNAPGTSWPVYPARWPEEKARDIAFHVIRLYGEEEGWRNERRFEAQRELSRTIAEAAKRDASERRLEAALRGRSRRRSFNLIRRSGRPRYRQR